MCVPNAPARRIRSTRLDPVALHEQRAAGVERGLGELDLPDVVLRDHELGLAGPEHVREGASVRDDAGRSGRERAVDRPVGREHPCQVELGDRLDDPGAADAGHVHVGESRLVRPRIAPDHADARLEGLRVDAHALDRPRRRPLSAGDLRALERRAGRARRGQQALAVAEHDLGVRADVDDEVHLVAEVRSLGEDDARGVGTDVARDAGQDVRPRAAVHGEAEVASGQPHRLVDGQRERRPAERRRIDPEQEVVHDRDCRRA